MSEAVRSACERGSADGEAILQVADLSDYFVAQNN